MKEISNMFHAADVIAAPLTERDIVMSSADWPGFTEVKANQMRYMPSFGVPELGLKSISLSSRAVGDTRWPGK
jgi:hypothetical protein